MQSVFLYCRTSITVYCVVPEGDKTSAAEFRIDGGRAVRVIKASSDLPVYNVNFFQSGKLAYGEHTLLITEVGEEDFRIDRIEYENGYTPTSSTTRTVQTTPTSEALVGSSPTSTSFVVQRSTVVSTMIVTNSNSAVNGLLPTGSITSRQNSTSATTASSSLPTGSPSPTNIAANVDRTVTLISTTSQASSDVGFAPQSNAATNHHVPVGTIAGIVIGALISVLISILILVLLRRRKRTRSEVSERDGSDRTPIREKPQPSRMFWFRDRSIPTPFNLETPPSNPSDSRTLPDLSSTLRGRGGKSHYFHPLSDETSDEVLPSSAYSGPLTPLTVPDTSTSSFYTDGAYNINVDRTPLTPTTTVGNDPGKTLDTPFPARIPQTSMGVRRPQYLSGETVVAGPSRPTSHFPSLSQSQSVELPPYPLTRTADATPTTAPPPGYYNEKHASN
ncbi:unnamed protein product [Cyclocybe aegerita]|uniref:Uncharacterized protein n=1 Tax=Cyclocybe aegerita TaxID=1973307 RepID=A0A8S0W160_CYCAE|nr:unnamed protein product [Cyclocybe aegerita]